MPRNLQGLQGLQGLGSLSKAQYDNFINKNKDLIAQHGYDPMYINNLYSNKQFIDMYGIDAFKSIPDINMRNTLYKDGVVNAEFDKLFKNNKSFDYNKYNQLSTDGKLKLMESDYLTPSEFNDSWKKRMKESTIGTSMNPIQQGYMGVGLSLMRNIASLTNAASKGKGMSEAIGLFTPGGEEAAKKVEFDKNQRILDNIYSEDADNAANKYSLQVGRAYQELTGMGDKAVYQSFIKAITPSYDKNSYNLGIPEYAKYFGNGSEKERKSPMDDFTIDDMRQVLAKKRVYDANMSPEMAMQALNNDAKRYATEHQGVLRKFGLFMKDVGISSLSYTADKVNGIYNLGLMAEDKFGDKPIVYVDDRGNVLDLNKTRFIKDRRGNLTYQGDDGNIHYVHRQQMDRTTLHNMGRNFDGSEDNSILNPQYWTRAEQFGTLDENEQKQYEKLGASPYKVAYNPNEDSDLLYESFKMMSFGIADAASQLLPYGVGLFGKTLSTASKAGKVVRGLGKALDVSGKMLTAETKVGQVAQGTAGALGIAYAYNRGAFQETLQQNLANAEEALVNTAKSDIYNRYQSDKQYKANVDRLVNARAAGMKADYLAQMRRDGGMRVADMKAVDKMIHAKAQDAILGELVHNNINERKSSKEYVDLQQKAIDGAGDAALNTFLTEGLKYGFVNNLGYRKFLYTNPAGLSKKVSSSLKGLKEITTSEGKKRMATEGSKFLTRSQKLKEFGKTLGSQVWGGAWTNGTDDMQVDAAERINEDSFNRYLQAYQNGKALASTYGFADSLYSYVKGLQNSMGQETTWNSATVGGLGSVLSFTPNMANIARLTTKEGREAYKNNFWREEVRDKENYNRPILNENGSQKYEDKGRMHNWRGQINYLIQNGVLNTYYGKKQSERDLQNHADFVNNLLDEYKDFEDIEHLVASNMAAENYTNLGDLKTANYLKALHAINTLNNLGKDSKDPTTMSSVVQNAKALIDKASQLNNVVEGKDNPFNDEEISNILSQYYAANPGIEQNEANSQKALHDIAENAQRLQEASKAFEDAGREISKIENTLETPIDPNVKLQLMLQKALVGHWQERKEKMQSEIGDSSSDEVSMDANTYIASVGGRKNAKVLVKAYNRQQRELENDLADQKKKTVKLQEELDKATNEYKELYAHGTWGTTDDATLKAENKAKDAKAELDNSKMQENYLEGMITRTANKRKSLEMDMSNMSIDETTRRVALAQEELTRYQNKLNTLREERKKYVNKNGERDKRYSPEKLADLDKSIADYEQNVASRKETLERNKEKVLTADEIFALDPVTRARMMNESNRSLYTDEQKREIEKLEQRLRMKDADALQKIQDIALLTQRINTNEDAYNRIASNPLAASKAFEEQRIRTAMEAAGIFDQRNAENLANIIKIQEVASMLDGNTEEGFMENYAYNLLRQHNHKLLDIIDEENLLPQYKLQLDKAKEWQKVTEDIDSVIYNSNKSEEWKKNIDNNISSILNNIDDKDSIIPTLEKIVDDTDNTEASKDIDYVLEGLRSLGYQRDSTILENRKQRKEREEADRKKREEEQKKKEEEAKQAADDKVKKEAEVTDNVSTTQNVTKDDIEGADLSNVASDEKDKVNDETSNVNIDNGIEVNDETSKPNLTENKASEKEVPIDNTKSLKPVDNEDLHQTPEGVIDGKLLMSDNYGNGSIGFGDMYYGEGKKGNFMVTRTDSTKETKNDDAFNSSKVNMGFKAGGNGIIAEVPLDSEEAIYNGYREGGKVKVGIASAKTKSSTAFPSMFNKKGDPDGATTFTVTKPAVYNKVEQNGQTYYKLESKGEIYFGESNKHGNSKVGSNITFDINGNKETLDIAPEDYETVTDEQKNKKNELFIADSLQKIDGDWYFNGTFANDKQQTQVKVSKNFDIDKAIEEQQEARKVALADTSIMTNDKHILDEGDHVIVKSESIDEQMEGLPTTDREVHTSDNNTDVDEVNVRGESEIENNVVTLGGNAMSRYEPSELEDNGKLVLKKGKGSEDKMNKFYAWMDAAGVKLQNIIDHELARIIQRNPHAKVKFMSFTINNNVTHDNDLSTHLMLVLDYDNKINKGITSIHDDANGGVIESQGKKYLMIGTASFGDNNLAKRELYNIIWNKISPTSRNSTGKPLGWMVTERVKFFREHPNERFYVSDTYTTEIVPHSQIPGYIVRQGVNDEGTPYRSVKELLSDKERNPMNYRFEDLAWGIQELSQFLVVGTSLDNVMVPRNVAGNLGSAFVLMPASNGRMVPSYLKVLKYTEMNDGTLKNRINDLLQQVVAPDYQTRMKAAIELSTIFHMNKEGDFILLRKHKNEVSLTHDGKIEKTFVLDSNFDRGEFIRAFEDMNPRINITARVLGSQDLLNEYDEAGALQTDAAMFGTAGSSYSIYALDKDGKMIIPATPVNTVTTTDENSEWRNTNRRQLIFNQRYYTYSPDNADIFYLDGTMVTDDKKVSQLKRIRQILDGDFLPATSKDVWDYYVLDSSKKPVAIKVNRNTKEVKEATEEQAKALIKKLAEEEAKRQREEAAQNSVKKESKVKFNDVEEVTLEGINDTGVTIDPNTGETITVDSETSGEAKPKEESTAVFGDYGNSKEEETKEITTAPKSKETMESSQAFNKIIGNKRYRLLLQKLIKNKWKDAPSDSKEWEKFLRDKNVEIDNIGSTKEEIETWIKTIEDCR